MKKTYTPKKNDTKQDWHVIDAGGEILGRVATKASSLLIGKHKASFTPNINVGDNVVIINAENVAVTGNKMANKIYYRHTGYPGGIKSLTLKQMMAKNPTKVIEKAVFGMLPKNKLRKQRMTHLHVYTGSEHPHEGQVKL